MEQLTKMQFEECKKEFIELGERALSLNHYQLAAETHIKDALQWKTFLTDPRIADYINSEMNIIRSASINAIIHQAPDSRSVGQAQLINALVKIDEAAQNKTGPVFIYSYVPLNNEQAYAPNIALTPTTEVIEEPEIQEPEIELPEEFEEEEEITLDGIEISTEIPRE